MSTVEIEIFEAGYSKDQILIKDIYFTIDSGKVLGLVGVSGAGKTTIIKAILDHLPHIKGEMRIHEHLGQYSYVPEKFSFYEGLTMQDHIELILSTNSGMTLDEKNRIINLIEAFDLTSSLQQFPINFSKGMKQKLSLLLGIIKGADFYIFDSPFSYLDVKGRETFIRAVKGLREKGASILIATTATCLEENLCDDYIYIYDGTIFMAASHAHLKVNCGNLAEDKLDCLYHLDLRRHFI